MFAAHCLENIMLNEHNKSGTKILLLELSSFRCLRFHA